MDSQSQITETVESFFDKQSAQKTILNLQSVLQKAFSSTDEALNDPLYRAEMLETVNATNNFILKLAIICEKNVLNE